MMIQFFQKKKDELELNSFLSDSNSDISHMNSSDVSNSFLSFVDKITNNFSSSANCLFIPDDTVSSSDAVNELNQSFNDLVYFDFQNLNQSYYDDAFTNLSLFEKSLLNSIDEQQIDLYLKMKYILSRYDIVFDEFSTECYMKSSKSYDYKKKKRIHTVVFSKDGEDYLTVRPFGHDQTCLVFRLDHVRLVDVSKSHESVFNVNFDNLNYRAQVYFFTDNRYNIGPYSYAGAICKGTTDRYLFKGSKLLIHP